MFNTLAASVLIAFSALSPSVSTPAEPTSWTDPNCMEDMPCWEGSPEDNRYINGVLDPNYVPLYPSTEDSDAFVDAIIEDAWASLEDSPVTWSDTKWTYTLEWVASWEGDLREFDQDVFHIPSLTNPNLTHYFKVVAKANN